MTAMRIDELARRLVRSGYTDNEPDARLAAVLMLLATEVGTSDPGPTETSDAGPHDCATP